jgi:heat shock protein HslJ
MALLTLLLSSCCGCRKNKSSIPLNGTEWRLIQLNGENIAADGNYRMTLGADGHIAGIGDCNNFSGSFTQNVKVLKIGSNLVSTRKMCLNQERENKFLKMLGEIDSYSIDGDRLMLIKAGDVQAIFDPYPVTVE